MDTIGYFLNNDRHRHEADHSPPSSAEDKNDEALPTLPHISS
jgi:hypothetical protein